MQSFFTIRVWINLAVILIILSLGAGISVEFYYEHLSAQLVQQQQLQLANAVTEKDQTVLSLDTEIRILTKNNKNLARTPGGEKILELQAELNVLDSAFSTFNQVQKQIAQANNLGGIDTSSYVTQQQTGLNLLLAKQYQAALTHENTLSATLTNVIIQRQYVLAHPPKPPAPTFPPDMSLPGSTFSVKNVSAQGLTYTAYTVKVNLAYPGIKIRTDTLNTSDCLHNCPLTSVNAFYSKDHAFAAMNGTYFCPAAYSSCSGKINSYDFPVYNSYIRNWINSNNILWHNRSMLSFNGSAAMLYPDAAKYSNAPVTAGFIMAPGLLSNGKVIVNTFPLDVKSLTERTIRSAIGVEGSTVIVADIENATVPQTAYVMQALGATDAIELDGGGSTAMIFNGKYLLGPGRAVPNAIVFTRN